MSHRCPYCPKTFRKSSHRFQHERTVHGDAQERERLRAENARYRGHLLQTIGLFNSDAEYRRYHGLQDTVVFSIRGF